MIVPSMNNMKGMRGGLGYGTPNCPTCYSAADLRAMGFEGQVPIYGVANSDTSAGEQSLVGNTAAIDCISAQQKIFVNSNVSDYLKELIYEPGANALNDSEKQWAWSQWNALQGQITNTLTPQNFSACQASIDYAQKHGYFGNDPITNILSTPYQSQMMVDGSGYTLAQMIAIGKQAIDYHLFGSSAYGPDVQGTSPAGIIQYIDVPTHTLQSVAVGVNTGLSPAQIASPSLTPDQQRLYQAGPNAVQLAANNPGTFGPPNVSVAIPSGRADNGQATPSSMSNPFGTNSNPVSPAAAARGTTTLVAPAPAPASGTDFMTQLEQPVLGVPLWGWIAGGVAAAVLL